MARPIRIANASGFYGDRFSAPAEMVEGGPIDVLTGDWLAELTLAILAMDRQRSADRGYARTFVPQITKVLPILLKRGIRLISNAGGLNPHRLAAALREVAESLGLQPVIAVVDGDDYLDKLASQTKNGLPHSQTGALLSPDLGTPLTANLYLGCWGIVRALQEGAQIVITGRVTDAALVIGPAAWWHGWSPTDLDPLAGALVAGHAIECGCQVTGGNFSFYRDISLNDVGFPIATIAADGSCVIAKHPRTGGAITPETVTAQLLYEIDTPAYISPDVVAHFDSIKLSQVGPNEVRLHGVFGSPPPPTLKLGITLAAGFRNTMTAIVGGYDAAHKVRLFESLAWDHLGGIDSFDDARSDIVIGREGKAATPGEALSTVRFAVADRDRDRVGRRFTAPLIELALCSIPGLSFTTAPQQPKPIGVFWPTLVSTHEAQVRVHIHDKQLLIPHPPSAERCAPAPLAPPAGSVRAGPLGDWVGARSGDKGGDANVGFWVRRSEDYADLIATVTPERLALWLHKSGYCGQIVTYPLPNLLAINVVLRGYLGRGVAANLSPDPQGKCLADFFRSRVV